MTSPINRPSRSDQGTVHPDQNTPQTYRTSPGHLGAKPPATVNDSNRLGAPIDDAKADGQAGSSSESHPAQGLGATNGHDTNQDTAVGPQDQPQGTQATTSTPDGGALAPSIAPTSLPPRGGSSARARRLSAAQPITVPGQPDHPARASRKVGTLFSKLFKDPTLSVRITKPEDKIDQLLEMLRVLGSAMLASGQSTPDVQETMAEVAAAYSMPPVRIIALPTIFAVQISGHDRRMEIGGVANQSMRLDQVAAIDDLVQRAKLGIIEPEDMLHQMDQIATSPARFGFWLQLIGHVLMTLAIGLLINPAWPAIPAYLVLGVVVGLLLSLSNRLPTLAAAMPVITAIIVTVLGATVLSEVTGEVPLRIIAPALVTFLPGLTLTIAALELTRNEVMSGATRLIYGTSQLILLAFGVVIGLALVSNVSPTNDLVLNSIGPWTPLLGITLLALGYVLAKSGPESSFLWLVLALTVTYAAQRLGMLLVPAEFSGFFGALLIVPLSRFLAQFKTAPPALVTQLVSFWILVPGSLGFIGITEAATGGNQSMTFVVTTVMTLFSIALGTLVGSGLFRDTGYFLRNRDSLFRRRK